MVIWVSAQPPHGMYTYIYTIHADICIYICIILLMVYRLETMICPAKLPLQGRGRD